MREKAGHGDLRDLDMGSCGFLRALGCRMRRRRQDLLDHRGTETS